MSWDRQLRIMVSAAAIVGLAACGGGGMTGVAPPGATGSASDSVAAPPKGLELTQAPSSTIKQVDAAKRRDDINLGQWQFEEPLQVVSDETLSLPKFVRSCTPIDPLFGIWYLSLTNVTVVQQPVTIPACSFRTKNVSIANFYIVQIDVSLSGVVVTTLSQPVVATGDSWTFNANAKAFSFQADHIYAFWVANYTGTGSPI